MPAKVVDASALGAIIFGENRADEAWALLQGADLYAPDLLSYELASVALKKIRAHPEDEESVRRALLSMVDLEINLLHVEPARILQAALRSGVTAYDAAYLCLAQDLGYPLVTFDERLAREVGV